MRIFVGALALTITIFCLWYFLQPVEGTDVVTLYPQPETGMKGQISTQMSPDLKPTLDQAPKKRVTARVYGSVVSGDSREGVAGAEVIFRQLDAHGDVRRVQTDDHGQFNLDNMPKGRWSYYAVHGQFLSFTNREDIAQCIIDDETQLVGPLKMQLKEVCLVSLNVVSSLNGQGVSGALVSVGPQPRVTLRTDGRGRVSLPLSRDIWEVTVDAPGYARARKAIGLWEQSALETKIVLQPGGQLNGVVVHADGSGIPGVTLTYQQDTDTRTTTSNEHGRFSFDYLLPGKFHLTANKWGYGRTRESLAFTKGQRELDVRMVLGEEPQSLYLKGYVIDQKGRPIQDAELWLLPGMHGHEVVFTNTSGAFQLETSMLFKNVNHRQVMVYARDFAPTIVELFEETLNYVRMEPGRTVTGKVLNTYGEGIGGAQVLPILENFPALASGPITTDDTGHFQIKQMPANFAISAHAVGYEKNRKELGPQQKNVELELNALGRLVGVVVDSETGKPIPEFFLKIRPHNSLENHAALGGIEVSHEEGRFQLDGLPTYPLELEIQAPNYPLGNFPGTRPQPIENVRLKTFPIGGGLLNLKGMIVGENGAPRPGVSVKLLLYRGFPGLRSWRFYLEYGMTSNYVTILEAMTNSEGIFGFENLPKVTGSDLVVMAPHLAQTRVADPLSLPQEERTALVVPVPDAATISGDVIRNDRMGMLKVQCMEQGLDGGYRKTRTIDDGTTAFHFDGLSAGRYQLRLMEGDVLMDQQVIDLEAGTDSIVDLFAQSLHHISGIALIEGAPATGFQVMLAPEDFEASTRMVRVDGEGNFLFEEVANGSYHLVLLPPLFIAHYADVVRKTYPNRKSIQMSDDDISGIWHFNRYGHITAQIPGLGDAKLSLVPLPRTDYKLYAEEHGDTILFPHVPPGSYSLRLHEGRQRQVLIEHLVMPDGGDLDLGLLSLDQQGKVRVRLVGETGRVRLSLHKATDPQFTYSTAVSTLRMSATSREATLQAPEGSYVLIGAVHGARKVSPAQASVEIYPNGLTEVVLEILPVTRLEFGLSDILQEDLASITLTSLDTGEAKNVQRLPDGLPVSDDTSYMFSRYGQVVGLSEGRWRMRATSVKGRNAVREFHLVIGKAQDVELQWKD